MTLIIVKEDNIAAKKLYEKHIYKYSTDGAYGGDGEFVEMCKILK